MPPDIVDTIINNLEEESHVAIEHQLDEVHLREASWISTGLKVGTNLTKGGAKVLKLTGKGSKAGMKATAQLDKLSKALKADKAARVGTKAAAKRAKMMKQLRRSVEGAGRVGKNLGKGKGFLKRMWGLCKKYPKTCAAAGLLTGAAAMTAANYDEIRNWMTGLADEGGAAGGGKIGEKEHILTHGAEWARRRGQAPLPGTLAARHAELGMAPKGK